jgi:hypothetical protein
MQSPSEEKAQAALLLWVALLVPARHEKKWQKSMQQPKVRLPLGILLIPVKSQNS